MKRKHEELLSFAKARKWYIAAVIAIFVVITIWFGMQLKPGLHITPEIQECVNKRSSELSGNYETGEIIVEFVGGLTRDDIENLLNNYGLKYEVRSIQDTYAWALVQVESGKEMEWICEFESNDIVTHASLNGISRTTLIS